MSSSPGAPPLVLFFLNQYLPDSHHTAFWGAHKYHGPAVDRNRIWAGVGDRPPLTVEVQHLLMLSTVYPVRRWFMHIV